MEKTHGESKHCKTGIVPRWKSDFPWLEVNEQRSTMKKYNQLSRIPGSGIVYRERERERPMETTECQTSQGHASVSHPVDRYVFLEVYHNLGNYNHKIVRAKIIWCPK